MPQDDETTVDDLEPRVDYIVCATHKADDLMGARRITPWIVRQQNAMEAIIAEHRGDRWTRLILKWSPVISTKQKEYQKRGRTARWEDDISHHLQPERVHGDTMRLLSQRNEN